MVRTDAPVMLATYLAGTGMPEVEIEDIIRGQFPAEDAAAVVSTVAARRHA